MSMTAYNILECRKRTHKHERAGHAKQTRPSLSPSSTGWRRWNQVLYAKRRAPRVLYVYNDTRPSGERESGSYSGTRQRNRIQFGLS